MPTVALIAIVLLGIAALGTDVFLMYWTQQNLQRASDAAALAGATYLSHTTFSGANVSCTYGDPNGQAKQAACTYALANGVLASEIQSITVVSDGICATPAACTITIVISRTIAATFARLLGFTQFTVKAQAVADLVATGQTYNMIPIGLDGYHAVHLWPGNGDAQRQLRARLLGRSGLRRLKRSEHIRVPSLTSGCGCTVTAGSTYQVGILYWSKNRTCGPSDCHSESATGRPLIHPAPRSLIHPRTRAWRPSAWLPGAAATAANQTATVHQLRRSLADRGAPTRQISTPFLSTRLCRAPPAPRASTLVQCARCSSSRPRGTERIKLGQSGTSTCCAVLPEVPNYWACRCTFSAHF